MKKPKVPQGRLEYFESELRNLRAEHQELGRKIQDLNESLQALAISDQHEAIETKKPSSGEQKISLNECKNLIGKTVRITNPHRGEPDTGMIARVGKLYITVKLPGENYRRRVASNLRLVRDVDHTK